MPFALPRKRASSLLALKTQQYLFILVLVALLIASQNLLLSSKVSFETTSAAGRRPLPSTPDDAIGRPSSSDPLAAAVGRKILPDGTVTFAPDEFLAGRPENYVNLPNVPIDPRRDSEVRALADASVPPPSETLLHMAPVPPGSNAIVGLASYPNFMGGWRKLVGSLRATGYDGHVIFGVHPAIPEDERRYLDRMGVTYYAVEVADCDPSILDGGAASDTDNAVRAKCSRGLEDLKLEWGRFEMARRWLRACESCSGWVMAIDARDVFFQSDPFASLGDPGSRVRSGGPDLLFVEEVAKYSSNLPETPHRAVNLGESGRFRAHVEPCYGKEEVAASALADRPMLCSGTVIGTSGGMHRFLSVLVDEFRRNNRRGPRCRSPATTDQWTMNHLYYRGRFGYAERTETLPWGTGPVLTVGKPCVDSAAGNKEGHSRKDMMVFDDGDGGDGSILNPHEGEGSPVRVAPTLHQYDRCRKWINPWFREHRHLYMKEERPEDEPAMPWVGSESDLPR